MRIKLAQTPKNGSPNLPNRLAGSPTEVRDSFKAWVDSNCPRQPVEDPPQKIRLLNNLKPYTPPWPR